MRRITAMHAMTRIHARIALDPGNANGFDPGRAALVAGNDVDGGSLTPLGPAPRSSASSHLTEEAVG
jgi:hypothetical protein